MKRSKSSQSEVHETPQQYEAGAATQTKKVSPGRKIHPVVIYPFVLKREYLKHVDKLFDTLVDLSGDAQYEKPLTIIESQTRSRNSWDPEFQKHIKWIDDVSTIVETDSIDTCHRWLVGLKAACERSRKEGRHSDVFWLIRADFRYADPKGANSDAGEDVLKEMLNIPLRVFSGACDLCLGEIVVEPSSSKQLIDTYGTYGLLYNWFPLEAQSIALKTSKPRTEFFAIEQHLLHRAIYDHRWYAYEQTLAILLQNMVGHSFRMRVEKHILGRINDDSSLRDSLADALAQVDRTERMLKMIWRETHAPRDPTRWADEYKKLDSQSSAICTSALVILERTLRAQ